VSLALSPLGFSCVSMCVVPGVFWCILTHSCAFLHADGALAAAAAALARGPSDLLPISPQALAVALLSLLLLLGQLGLYRYVTPCAPVRRWLDARTPSVLLPLTTPASVL
jgi:hypothetical protein